MCRAEKFIRNFGWETLRDDITCNTYRSGLRPEDNIKMVSREMGCEGVDRIRLAQDRAQRWELLNTIVNLRIPYKQDIA